VTCLSEVVRAFGQMRPREWREHKFSALASAWPSRLFPQATAASLPWRMARPAPAKARQILSGSGRSRDGEPDDAR